MTQNRRIFLNIVATYGRSLYSLAIGLFCGRWTLMALGETDYDLQWGQTPLRPSNGLVPATLLPPLTLQ